MTLEEVQGARDALVAQGVQPSHRAILAHLGKGSKRDVAKYLQELAANVQAEEPPPEAVVCGGDPEPYGLPPEPPAAPDPAPDPAPADPVARAAHRLAQAEQGLVEAREHLLGCKLELMAMQPLKVQDLLRGSLHASDESLADALADVESAKQAYDLAWRAREDARADLARLHAVHVRRHQVAWVERHHPELVHQLAHWQEKLRTAPSDRLSAEAKKNVGAAQMKYEYAVRTAPVSPNGTTAEEG